MTTPPCEAETVGHLSWQLAASTFGCSLEIQFCYQSVTHSGDT